MKTTKLSFLASTAVILAAGTVPSLALASPMVLTVATFGDMTLPILIDTDKATEYGIDVSNLIIADDSNMLVKSVADITDSIKSDPVLQKLIAGRAIDSIFLKNSIVIDTETDGSTIQPALLKTLGVITKSNDDDKVHFEAVGPDYAIVDQFDRLDQGVVQTLFGIVAPSGIIEQHVGGAATAAEPAVAAAAAQ